QIVITVKYCMKNDVVHKDIKMENIVIDMETGKTILIDFGAATSRNIKTKEIQGTVGYVPPEWFLYEMYLDEPGTVWSLGILLYGMLKGTLPFSTEYEICTQRIEKMAQMQDLTSDAQHLIENCLEFDFSSRFSFEEILKSNWMKESTLSWNQLISNS
uniref:non-specific serine/threonine protein kinase n=1 Tax=Acrobeloides nanus TaxID=290746 RepID=A0A914DHE4_9BILA